MTMIDKMNEDVTITRKLADGTTFTFKSPKGAQSNMAGLLGDMMEQPEPMGGLLDSPAPQMMNLGGKVKKIYNEGYTAPGQAYAIAKSMGYADGGEAQRPLYNMLQEDIDYIQEMVDGGATPKEVADYYISTWQLPGGDHDYETIGEVYDEVAGSGSDSDMQMDPAQIASMWARQNGVEFTDYNLEKLEQLVNEAYDDWRTLPDYEKAEWGSVAELVEYYLEDGSGEYGIKRGQVQGYWTGGEVGKGDPEEGDTADHLGGGFGGIVFRQGQWVYARSGNPVQKHILKKLNEYANDIADEEGSVDPGGDTDLMGSEDELAGGVPELKEAEGKNYGWAQRAIAAEKIIRELEDDPEFNAAGAAIGKQEWISNIIDPTSDLFRSEKGQRYRRAVEAFTAAILRKDTGAQVNNQELTRTARTFFPDLGTTAGTKSDLRNQRASVIESFIAASGPRAGEVTQLAEESLGEGWRTPGPVEDKPLLTGEDWGGVAGGTIGAIGGGLVGGPVGAALGGAGGAYIGRAIAQYATTDDDLLASISPEVNDIIDSAISGVGGGAIKVGSVAWKAAKASIARRMAREGTSTADEVARIADDVAKGGILKGASGATSRLAAQVSGRVPAEILENATAKGFTSEVAHGGKPFLVNHNTGRVIDGLTGSLLPKTAKTAKDVLAKTPGYNPVKSF